MEQSREAILEERLQLMRSLEGESADHCRALADETLDKYAPMADEIGLHEVQRELEELSMQYGYPDDYKEIRRLLQESEASCQLVFDTFKAPVCSMLESIGVEFDMKCRMKSVYSIWHKMKKDGKAFDDIYDLFAVRIIYKVPDKVRPLNEIGLSDYTLEPSPLPIDFLDSEKLTCWRIYTVITALYRVQPHRIKDWVTHPKPSGYQALQITCMGPDCNWVEVQIRSERMNYEAEYGKAAHWKYKKAMSIDKPKHL